VQGARVEVTGCHVASKTDLRKLPHLSKYSSPRFKLNYIV
jgi:hypothetical protein